MSVVERDDGAEIWWEAGGPEGAPAVVLVMGLGYPPPCGGGRSQRSPAVTASS